jgi:hypothetical protein
VQGRDQAGPQTRPRAACGRRAGLARPRAPSFFACDLVAVAEAPERAHAHLGSLLSQPRLQLGQGHVRHLGQRRVDEVGMGLGSTREPVPALRLRSGVPSRPAHPLPADRAGGAHAKSGRGLTAGQARVDGGQNTRAEVEGQRFRHTGWPPSPARTLNQIGPDLGTPTDSIGANTALVLQPGFTWAPSALAPVTFAGALLGAATPRRPVLDGCMSGRLFPDPMPQQASDFRHGERQKPRGARDGGFSPRWRACAPQSDPHGPAGRA